MLRCLMITTQKNSLSTVIKNLLLGQILTISTLHFPWTLFSQGKNLV